jgi:threonine dehydrogenase-like Zn-dependent dehydrogenase
MTAPPAGRRVAAVLGALERVALACPPLQRRLVADHARAIHDLRPALAACLSRQPAATPSHAAPTIAVVGGGLFPRTALALARVWPAARVTIVDADAAHLECARRVLATHGVVDVTFVHATWDPRAPHAYDLVILPLALVGDRDAVYSAAGPPRLVHDWLWRPRGRASTIISWWLLKRLNLVVN